MTIQWNWYIFVPQISVLLPHFVLTNTIIGYLIFYITLLCVSGLWTCWKMIYPHPKQGEIWMQEELTKQWLWWESGFGDPLIPCRRDKDGRSHTKRKIVFQIGDPHFITTINSLGNTHYYRNTIYHKKSGWSDEETGPLENT